MSTDIKSLGSVVWSIAELLRGDYRQSEYGKVILPFVVLRRLDEDESGSASLAVGETKGLSPITEFGANPYTEEEEKSLWQIIDSFNERHGTTFSREDFLRFERVNREIVDDEMEELLRNNPADVSYGTFSRAFLQGMIKVFQQESEMRNIVMSDSDAREQATRHFSKRAQRQAHGKQG
jgi:type I restriction enzyme R subunit